MLQRAVPGARPQAVPHLHSWGLAAAAVLALALDAGGASAARLVSECTAGGMADAAARAFDARHLQAFAFSTLWMLLACVAGTSVMAGAPAAPRASRLAWRLLAMACAMPLACIAGWLAARHANALAPALAPFAFGAAMLACCAALLHLSARLPLPGRARLATPPSITPPSEPTRSFPC